MNTGLNFILLSSSAKSIFEIGSNVSSILSLAGFCSTCIFFLIRTILSNRPGLETVKMVVNWIFIIAIVGMVLGFTGWTIGQLTNNGHNSKTTLSFSLFDKADKNKELQNVLVSAIDGHSASNQNGYVTIIFDTPPKDSVYLIFLSQELGISSNRKISIKNCPDELYLELGANKIGQRSAEVLDNSQKKESIKEKSVKLMPKSSYDHSSLGLTIKSLLYKVPFNSSLNDVLTYEFGGAYSNSIDYDKLPIAIECDPAGIRYYWRYLHDSKIKDEVYSFLTSNGLLNFITNDTYLVYGFKENKLVRIDIRFFTNDGAFNKSLVKALLNDNNYNKSEYLTENVQDFYYATGSSYKDVQSFEVLMSTKDGFNSCIHDWWHK